jgi:hypothetical protein
MTVKGAVRSSNHAVGYWKSRGLARPLEPAGASDNKQQVTLSLNNSDYWVLLHIFCI